MTININLTVSAGTDILQKFLDEVDELKKGQRKIMAAIDDLKAAVARNNASTLAELQAISTKLASSANADDPDVAAAAVSLNALSDKLDAETTALNGGTPPSTGGAPVS